MAVALAMAQTTGAHRSGEEWGHVLFYVLVVIALVLVLRHLRRRRHTTPLERRDDHD